MWRWLIVGFWGGLASGCDESQARDAASTEKAPAPTVWKHPDGSKWTDEALWGLVDDEDAIAEGRAIHDMLCGYCHGSPDTGGGEVPLNVFDAKWFNGGAPAQIAASIGDGIEERGMPPWNDALNGEEVAQVTAYLLQYQERPEQPEE